MVSNSPQINKKSGRNPKFYDEIPPLLPRMDDCIIRFLDFSHLNEAEFRPPQPVPDYPHRIELRPPFIKMLTHMLFKGDNSF